MSVLRNAARCLKCDSMIESKNRHDFKECFCGNVFVDGGFDYIRHGVVNKNLYQDLSIIDEC